MASIKPFAGLRPAPELASQVASLPYDVMNSEEAKEITDKNRNSFLRVTKSEVDLPENTDIYSDAVYEKAEKITDVYGTRYFSARAKSLFLCV